MYYRTLNNSDIEAWAILRKQLWPQDSLEEHKVEIINNLKQNHLTCIGAFEDNLLLACIELSLRNIVDGCISSPVAYIEGWIVSQAYRGQGIGKALVEQAKQWGLNQGCSELGSDTETTRHESIKIHKALGFEEVDQVVNFKMKLKD